MTNISHQLRLITLTKITFLLIINDKIGIITSFILLDTKNFLLIESIIHKAQAYNTKENRHLGDSLFVDQPGLEICLVETHRLRVRCQRSWSEP